MIVLEQSDLDYLIAAARDAGREILDVYETKFSVSRKQDASPLTEADLRSHHLITQRLRERYAATPILSEENKEQASYEVRQQWRELWLVDPLDGTKEFIKRNGQFTVNIAFIRDGRPVAGVVYAPALQRLYYALEGHGAFVIADGTAPSRLHRTSRSNGERLVIAGSLSHPTPEMDAFLAEQRRKYKEVEFLPMGSSLKICLVAEGRVDLYPRFGPTMEWDTAAAHAIAREAGCKVLAHGTSQELAYNKQNLLNGWFVVT
jgi:3'(2'), 5'-bisphosphate nucleotidase